MPIPVDSFPAQTPVDYANVRSSLEAGDLLLCSGTGKFSRTIRKFTQSIWSHVGFIMPLQAIDRIMLLESVESVGVRTVPLSKYVNNYDNRGRRYPGSLAVARHSSFGSVKQQQLLQFSRFAVDRLGYPYDKDEILKIGIRIAIGGRKSKRDKEYICSEYVHECYASVGIHVPYNKSGFIAPADFARAADVTLHAVLVP